MYSRYHGQSDPSIKIPENYSGCAFSEAGAPTDVTPKGTAGAHRIDVGKPSPRDAAEGDSHPDRPIAPPPPRPILLPPPSTHEEAHDAPESSRSDRGETPDAVPASIGGEPTEKKPGGPHPASRDLPSPFRNLFGRMGSAFPFSHGIGFDELLILGLILLLARNDSDSDLILWLVLLLFCG